MRSLLLLASMAIATPVMAADYAMRIVDNAGRPVPDAVVTIHVTGRAVAPIKFPWRYEIVQQGLQFAPRVLIVPAGASVTFPNRDRTRHHVYSFSPINRFELKLYSREDNRAVPFPRAGVAALGCNIHDAMSAFVKVVDTPFAAKSGADGQVRLSGIAPGKAIARIWHPALKGAGNEIARSVDIVAAGTTETVRIALRPGS